MSSTAEYYKQYRINNVDKLKAYQKIRFVCECGMEVNKVKIKQHQSRHIHKDKMEELNLYGRLLTKQERYMSETNILKRKEEQKKYYQANRNKALEKSKQFNIDNVEKNKQYYLDNYYKINERMFCDCGKDILKRGLNKHKKTKYHINSLNECKDIL
jgi:hypothetical protein